MAHKSLAVIYRHFVKESHALLITSQAPSTSGASISPHRLSREMCVVRLDDAWTRACRELIMSSACDEPRTRGGRVVPKATNATSRKDVLTLLGPSFGRPEPSWGNPVVLLNIAQRLGLNNYPAVSLGMAVTPNPTEHLHMVRNFLVHRNQRTAMSVTNVKSFYTLQDISTAEYLFSSLLASGQTIFESWISTLRIMVQIAIQ